MEEIPNSDNDGEYLPEMRWNDTGWARKILFHGGLFRFRFRLDLDSLLDSDLEERDLEDEENEIIDDVTLLTLPNVLWRAWEITVEEENKKWGKRKRSKRPQFVPSNNMFRSIKSLNQETRNLFTPSFQRRRA